MHIDLYQDIVCPWCRIGKKNFNDALARFLAGNQQEVTISYHAFQLDPNLPAEGKDFVEAMTVNMGGEPNVKLATDQLTAAGARIGVTFRFDRISRMPNTLLAHRAIALTEAEADKAKLLDALYEAYFEQGRDVAKLEEVLLAAEQAALDSAILKQRLTLGEGEAAVLQDRERARQIGVAGVPFFVFNGKYSLSGAYPAEEFLGLLNQVAEPS